MDIRQLYQHREKFLKHFEALEEKIRNAEAETLKLATQRILESLPTEIDIQDNANVVLGVEYANGKLVKIASSLNTSLEDKFDNVANVEDLEEIDVPEEEDVDSETDSAASDNRRRAKSVGFKVKFADGKTIKCKFAKDTLIEALRYMGLERSSKYNGASFTGYPLIGKTKRPDQGSNTFQERVDGWWIYVNMSNEKKISCLQDVAKMLNIEMEIITDENERPLVSSDPKSHGRRALFSLNGSAPMNKNRSVWETVRSYLEVIPIATFDEIAEQFPLELQGSYGVVRSIEDIDERIKRNETEHRRWFLDKSDILTAGDDVRFAVSSEWGLENYSRFQEHVKKEFNWTLQEV